MLFIVGSILENTTHVLYFPISRSHEQRLHILWVHAVSGDIVIKQTRGVETIFLIMFIIVGHLYHMTLLTLTFHFA